MAQMNRITLTASTWTQITNADVTAITFQNVGGGPVLIKGTVGAVAPTTNLGALQYDTNQGEKNETLANLFPGVSGATRVYAYSEGFPSTISVNHA